MSLALILVGFVRAGRMIIVNVNPQSDQYYTSSNYGYAISCSVTNPAPSGNQTVTIKTLSVGSVMFNAVNTSNSVLSDEQQVLHPYNSWNKLWTVNGGAGGGNSAPRVIFFSVAESTGYVTASCSWDMYGIGSTPYANHRTMQQIPVNAGRPF